MKRLRRFLDTLGKPFQKGGWLERLHPLWEATDTFFYTTGRVTGRASFVRDGTDLKRVMITVVIALFPAVFMAFYNTGLQANLAVAGGAVPMEGWRSALYQTFGFAFDPGHFLGCFILGGLYYLPVLAVTFVVGLAWEALFAAVRGHEISEGFFVTGMLFPLILPPTIPLWQVALGISFGVVIGKEVFGGVGMNIFNPALTARVFLFFAYPGQISGDQVWIAASGLSPDGVSGATRLTEAVAGGTPTLAGMDWWDAFIGCIPGCLGETSTLACLLGAALLIVTGVGSWRTMLGVTLGTYLAAALFNVIGSDTNPAFSVPFHWHVVLGGWAFGAVFMATDPVSSAFTNGAKYIYGFFIGLVVILIRVINPAYPEGMMLAILFMNMFAPLIDHYFIKANVKRRRARNAEG